VERLDRASDLLGQVLRDPAAGRPPLTDHAHPPPLGVQ
jgi:hypothetical protein